MLPTYPYGYDATLPRGYNPYVIKNIVRNYITRKGQNITPPKNRLGVTQMRITHYIII